MSRKFSVLLYCGTLFTRPSDLSGHKYNNHCMSSFAEYVINYLAVPLLNSADEKPYSVSLVINHCLCCLFCPDIN